MWRFVLFTTAAFAADAPATFDQTVRPFVAKTCVMCHNASLASGGLNLAQLNSSPNVIASRDVWEKVVAKMHGGEMPPPAAPRPDPAQLQAVVAFLKSEFLHADLAQKPDPGRVTARRLNRYEYSNTIRDLLGVEFRAEQDFPADDSGYGFDSIGDVLTVSPALMEKYLNAAERIASKAIGGDPLPKAMVSRGLKRLDLSSAEFTTRAEFDADYLVRVGTIGSRGDDGKPITLNIWVDGKLLRTATIDTKISPVVKTSDMAQREFEEMRLHFNEGTHTVRAAFINDDFPKTLGEKERYNAKKNKYVDIVEVLGPYESKIERPSRKRVLICDPASGAACVDKIVTELAHRAYRRPVTKAETASLARVVAQARTKGYTPDQSIQFAVEAVLVSPNFLFRIEHNPRATDPNTITKVSDLELASRLSYFLWSSMPDEELLRAAEKGKLHTPAVLEAQVKRMLADPKAVALAENFAGQWLEIRNLETVKPDPKRFPEWNTDLRDAMRTETRLFFQNVLQEDRPVSDFIDAKYTFLNDRLAKHYGIPGVTGPEFRRVELATDQRSGILTQASVLTVSSYGTRTSPVLRGKYLLDNILGAPPPPAPADVPALDEEAVGITGSMRQQLEKHRVNAMCASCHARMDVLGFGLENYDAVGKWRTMDGKFAVDAAGKFPGGKSFDSPAEMKALLADDVPDFARCLTAKLLTYALGRGLEKYDNRTVEEIAMKAEGSGYRFQALIAEIVRSLPFQARRGEAILQNEPNLKGAARP
jgi:mono/diheme cytochrome c family protein